MFYEGETTKENHKRTCVDIRHNMGHTEMRYIDLAIQTKGIAGKTMMTEIHGEGSSFSYGRRYLTCMIWNIPTGDDDDGNAAGGTVDEFITKDQAKAITKRLKAVYGKNISGYLEWIEAETVDTILAKNYGDAIDGIEKAEAAQKEASKQRQPGQEG